MNSKPNMTIIIFFITIFILGGCKKKDKFNLQVINGVNHVINGNTPTGHNKIKLKQLCSVSGNMDSISSFMKPRAMCVDEKGCVFIFDGVSRKIKKFDEKGNYLLSFGTVGQGPGEYSNNVTCIFSQRDSLLLYDADLNRLQYFNNNGLFLKSRIIDKISLQKISTFNDNYLSMNRYVKGTPDNYELSWQISMHNQSFDSISTVATNVVKFDKQNKLNPTSMFIFYASGNKNLYITKNSTEQYEIDCFDLNNKKEFKILKKTKRIKYSEGELTDLSTRIKVVKNNNTEQSKAVSEYKRLINGVWVDNKERLWVLPAQDNKNSNKYYFEVFHNGIFIDTVSINNVRPSPNFAYFFTIFKNDKIYIISRNNENDDVNLVIYAYYE